MANVFHINAQWHTIATPSGKGLIVGHNVPASISFCYPNQEEAQQALNWHQECVKQNQEASQCVL